MKKLLIPLFVFSGIGALFIPKDNYFSLIFKIISIALLAFIIMQLMSKVPSKNLNENEKQEDNENDID